MCVAKMQLHVIYWLLLSVQLAEIETSSLTDGGLVPFLELKKKTRNTKKSPLLVSSAVIEMYQKQTASQDDLVVNPTTNTFGANSIRIYDTVESISRGSNTMQYKFNIKLKSKVILEGAELVLRKSTPELLNTEEDIYQRITVADVIKNPTNNDGPITNIIDTKLVDVRSTDSITLDVESAIRRWMKPKRDIEDQNLLISVQNIESKTQTSKYFTPPFLVIYLTDNTLKKKTPRSFTERRSFRTRHIREKKCQRRKMYVNFKELGWDEWILVPDDGYDAYYCSGECNYPFSEHMNASNHAILQSIAHIMEPDDVPKPCCVPTKLNSITMITFDEEQRLTVKNYADMVVASCGCR